MARKGENIRKRKDGRWEGRYKTHDFDGEHYHSVYAKSYLEVKEKMKLEKGSGVMWNGQEIFGPPVDIFDTVAADWLRRIKLTRKDSTYLKYTVIYEKHLEPELGKVPLPEITEKMVTDTVEQTMSDSMKKSVRCVANQILKYGFSHYHMQEIRLQRIITSSKKEPVRILNLSEQAKLLKYINQDMDIYKLGILVCLSTGLRLGEICSLKWEDIDINLKVLHVNSTVQRIRLENCRKKTTLLEGKPKTTFSVREIPISEPLLQLLKKYHTAGIYFLNGNRPMDPRTYQNKFKTYLREADLADNHFHILRHTFATNCINNGADVKSLSEILGHSDVNITLNRYVHPSIDVKRNHLNTLFTIYGQYLGQPF